MFPFTLCECIIVHWFKIRILSSTSYFHLIDILDWLSELIIDFLKIDANF